MAISTIGTKLEYSSNGTSFTELTQVVGIPDLGSQAEEIDVTCLTDKESASVPGVKQTQALQINLLFNNLDANDNYRLARAVEVAGNSVEWRITLADGTTVEFEGKCTTAINAVAVNARQEFSLYIYKSSDYTITNPVNP